MENKKFRLALDDLWEEMDCGKITTEQLFDEVLQLSYDYMDKVRQETLEEVWKEINHGGYCQACGFRIDYCDDKPCRVRKILNNIKQQEKLSTNESELSIKLSSKQENTADKCTFCEDCQKDVLPFKHGSEGTHYACQEMMQKFGKDVGCCGCNKHVCQKEAV